MMAKGEIGKGTGRTGDMHQVVKAILEMADSFGAQMPLLNAAEIWYRAASEDPRRADRDPAQLYELLLGMEQPDAVAK